ncbi:MAG: BrnT family toxin [Nitrospirae bacterium]|nr:BrnT family toxin [Nitrospirota bacterium]
MKLTFEWDEVKANANFKKHKVSFEEGKSIFNDPFLFTFQDKEHSIDEEHYINIGISANGQR